MINSANRVILSGGFESNETVYCGTPGETLTAIFRDGGGDGACGSRACVPSHHLVLPPTSALPPSPASPLHCPRVLTQYPCTPSKCFPTGYCCQYGGGSYYQVRIGNTLLKQGGVFTFVDTYSFGNAPVWSFGAVQSSTSITAVSTVVLPNSVPLGSYGYTIQATAAVATNRLEVRGPCAPARLVDVVVACAKGWVLHAVASPCARALQKLATRA